MPLWRQDHGTGAHVLLVHGLGASAHYWDAVIRAVGDRRFTAPDLLGFGRSPAPPGATYDVACHVRALAPFARPGTVVVGHSTGAVLAAALAAAQAEVKAVVLVGLPAFPDPATARREIGRVGLMARLTVEGRLAGRLLCEATCHLRPLAIAAAPLIIRGMPRAVAGDAARHTWRSYGRTLENVVVRHSVSDDLDAVSAPVVFLHGTADSTAPVVYVEQLATRLEEAGRAVRIRTVPGDHHLPVRNPEAVAAVLADL